LQEVGGTGEIKAKVTDRDALPASLQGKVVYFTATKSAAHGWTGLKVVLDTYKGKTSKVLKVTPTAEIGETEPTADETAPPAPANAPQAPEAPARHVDPPAAEKPAPGPAKPAATPSKAKTPDEEAVETVVRVEKFLRRRTSLWSRCIKATVDAAAAIDPAALSDPENYRANMTQIVVEECAKTLPTTLFISCDRAGMADGYPYRDVEKFIELAKAGKGGAK
jgi:hypothetical protein